MHSPELLEANLATIERAMAAVCAQTAVRPANAHGRPALTEMSADDRVILRLRYGKTADAHPSIVGEGSEGWA